jgi:hypothetical protein
MMTLFADWRELCSTLIFLFAMPLSHGSSD